MTTHISEIRRLPWTAVTAGIVAMTVSYAGPLAIILAAADAAGLTAAQSSSWVWAVSIGAGLTCLGLSWWSRAPIITAFSTPGAAILVTALPQHGYAEAVGAFVVAGVAATALTATGVFTRLLARIPEGVVSAMLAGILFSFGTGIFTSVRSAPLLAGGMLLGYLLARRFLPTYAVVCALAVGLVVAGATGGLDVAVPGAGLALPHLTVPEFSVGALVGIGVPMLVATLAGQYAPGMAVLRADGYTPDERVVCGTTGAVSVLLAPFGSHAVNPAAITAAICTGPDAHPDPARRWVAGVSCGVGYLVVGCFGSTLVALFTGLPDALVATLAGVALLGALSGSLVRTVAAERGREAAVVTFLATASGVTIAGVGSPFWGLLAGLLTYFLAEARRADGDPAALAGTPGPASEPAPGTAAETTGAAR
ncbi:benzoate/H(+) symporter BenE family transporter [Streptomyces solicathayae]|uniref:Benzoate/H(+) symporter BenE family transporter n=1 Tax=Streptomyces solicathayae TaxID=3081768 RepID=A0ABZ0LVI1_9ACTN|nr:benzoate/H(+) symporter BenE family transporter [Streptomyces sp. HUAS YS2]WOX22783.1 benzoate/H(+) symporter BenE family transporter [Streptomyces sp. HUAS YS2]